MYFSLFLYSFHGFQATSRPPRSFQGTPREGSFFSVYAGA